MASTPEGGGGDRCKPTAEPWHAEEADAGRSALWVVELHEIPLMAH